MITRPKRRIARRFAFVAAFLSLFTIVLGVGAAQAAIPDSDISQSTVHSTAYRIGNGDNLRFYGALHVVGQGVPGATCYRMEQLTPAGVWTSAGFYPSEFFPASPITMCSFASTVTVTWSIHDGLSVRGIRFFRYDLGGANVGTHCNTATSCRNMYQGT